MKPILVFSFLNFPVPPKHRSDHILSMPRTLQGRLTITIIKSKLPASMDRALQGLGPASLSYVIRGRPWRVISRERLCLLTCHFDLFVPFDLSKFISISTSCQINQKGGPALRTSSRVTCAGPAPPWDSKRWRVGTGCPRAKAHFIPDMV